MEKIPDRLELHDLPPYIESWAVAKVTGFVVAILERWRRAHPNLPEQFLLVMCPIAELNAQGGLPAKVYTLTDPRLTCRHFTGCSRPYYAMIFTGADAETRCGEIQQLLPWSESYRVAIQPDGVQLHFIAATEDLGEPQFPLQGRRVADLLESGELLQILA